MTLRICDRTGHFNLNAGLVRVRRCATLADLAESRAIGPHAESQFVPEGVLSDGIAVRREDDGSAHPVSEIAVDGTGTGVRVKQPLVDGWARSPRWVSCRRFVPRVSMEKI